MLSAEEQLKHYIGDVPLLLSLKAKAEKGPLSNVDRIMAKGLLDDKITQIQVNADSIDWSKYKRKPMDHHKESIGFLKGKQRGILADDMGLGKSFSSIGAATEVGANHKIIICPKYLMTNWKREVEFFTPNVTIIKDGKSKWEVAEFIIMNYEKVAKYLEEIRALGAGVYIADEASGLKNAKTLRAKTFAKLIARSKAHVWLLTGTPIANRPIDYFNLLKICRHPLTIETGRWTPMDNSWVRFGKRFCAGKHTGYGWDFSGASNIEMLHQETKEYVLRRTKETHLNLPDKNVFPVYLGLEDKKGYDLVVEEAYQKRWEESRDIESTKFGSDPLAAEQLVTFSIIRKFLAYEKIKDGSTLGAIEDAIAEDKKVVVFTNYTGVIDALLEELGDSCTFIDGRLTKEGEKQANVDRFQTDPKCKVILCNYAVGKMGWNLTAGRVTVMNDMNWSPETNMQAQDRIYRIGQEYSVNILYLLYEGTVETLLHEIIMLKIQIIRHAVDGIPMTDDPARLKVLSEQLFGSLDKRN